MEGCQILQYDVVDKLGAGAQGEVYKVLDVNDNKFYAMKVINIALDSLLGRNGGANAQLRTELAILKKLKHPNLCSFRELVSSPDSGQIYIIMDYVEGGAVADDATIAQGQGEAMPEEAVRSLFRQLVMGLEYLHFHGVLHRDIKPSNLLIDRNSGKVKICDFGVSSICAEHKSAKLLGEEDLIFVGESGTMAMMCPEGLGAGPDHIYHGKPADVWAAGVTLFALLYGRLPFDSTEPDKLREQIMTKTLSFPSRPKVSRLCRDVITRALEKDPRKRCTLFWLRDHAWVKHSEHLPELTPSQKVRFVPNENDLLRAVQLGSSMTHRMGRAISGTLKHMSSRGSFHHFSSSSSDTKHSRRSWSLGSGALFGNCNDSRSSPPSEMQALPAFPPTPSNGRARDGSAENGGGEVAASTPMLTPSLYDGPSEYSLFGRDKWVPSPRMVPSDADPPDEKDLSAPPPVHSARRRHGPCPLSNSNAAPYVQELRGVCLEKDTSEPR